MRLRPFISRLLRKCVPFYQAQKTKTLYASHMPVLLGVGDIVAPKRVLELGSGTISTPAFLKPGLFPSIERLDSLEDDPVWGEKVRRHIGTHPKLRLQQVASVPQWAAEADLAAYDLIFIDDSVSAELRARTIGHVLARAAADTVVVIHDFEMPEYQAAVPTCFERLAISSFRPMTGVVWRSGRWTAAFEQLARYIEARKTLSPLRHSAWRRSLTGSAGHTG